MVFEKVAVGALGAVEEVQLVLVFCRGGRHLGRVGVRGGVAQAGGSAEEGAARAVPEAQETGAHGGEDDVAGRENGQQLDMCFCASSRIVLARARVSRLAIPRLGIGW